MILDDLLKVTTQRLKQMTAQVPLAKVKAAALAASRTDAQDVYDMFLSPGIHIIGEIKRASPSKGMIAEHFPYLKIAQEYDQAGATAISVLTEPHYFKGHLAYLKKIAQQVRVPVLRKDFIISPYMIYQAKAAGARIILLIVGVLSKSQLKNYLHLAHSLGLAALVEAHSKSEVKTALDVGAKMIGVNNRNLKDFTVSFNNSLKLRPLVPKSIAFIAESGVKSVADVQMLMRHQVNGVLIGETLMRSKNREAFIKDATKNNDRKEEC